MSVLLTNLGLVTLLAFLGSLLYRQWPPRYSVREQVLHALAAGSASVFLLAFPFELAPGLRIDLRHVPTALITVRYGPLWGALAALPALVVRALQGGIGVRMALLSSLGVLLMGTLLHRRAHRPGWLSWRAWWLPPLLFSLNGLGLLTLPNGEKLLAQVYLPLLVANSVAFVVALLVIQSRLDLLRATHTYRLQAQTDPLTGLANRRRFHEDVTALAPGDHLLLLDIDHFKRVNDSLGHAEGDAVLRRIAGILVDAVRPSDQVYRIGGEEFAVVLRRAGLSQARSVADRCLRAVRRPPPSGPQVTMSGGLATREAHETPGQTFARADAALYAAKEAGRDRLMLASSEKGETQGETGASDRQALRDTLALLAQDQDPTPQHWQELLQAAVACVPGAEAGTLYVAEQGDFVVCAQQGFSDALLGRRDSPASLFRWYAGSPDAWEAGRPRVLRGAAVQTASSAAGAVDHSENGQVRYALSGRVQEIRETLGVPVVAEGHVVAFLNLDRFSAEDAFGPEALARVSDFAAQMAVLLGARARRQREARRHRELEALARITAALRDASSADAIISAMTAMTSPLLDARYVVYLAYDRERDVLTSRHILGLPEGKGNVTLPRGRGLSWAAVAAGDVLRVADIREDQRVYRPAFLSSGAMLAAPLLGKTGLWGVLVVTREQPFGEDDAHLARTLGAHAVTALERAAHVQTLEDAREGTLLALGLALEARDFETRGHTTRVVQLAAALGAALGLSPAQQRALRDGAYLHDLGKVQVPDAVLLKPGPLTPQEWALMQQHAVAGEAIARHIPGLSPEALGVVRHHHERWDGLGYPDGLAGEAIPLLARIFAVCDVFDALTSARPYKPAWSWEAALQEIGAQAGRHFDPQVVRVFFRLLRQQDGAMPET
ncbi:HD domain-containing phosphohydrolase [Deinococcus sp. YIM 77859]|uniref:bifunctional diguanylate cyclase/phosphohydrolase n=1 Tax=Deinococcus sp. YIM 77859 TaxID=1540221 RepID=UPI0018CCC1FC|nr:HD domain-containing phosphohydrolase [Deinococcus sp. YIM 77859]